MSYYYQKYIKYKSLYLKQSKMNNGIIDGINSGMNSGLNGGSSKSKKLMKIIEQTYVRVQKSGISGCGVFAIKDIPKGIDPFVYAEPINYKMIDIKKEDVDKLDEPTKKIINDFFHPIDGIYSIPENGLNSLDISFFLNHSKKPNLKVDCDQRGKTDYCDFRTTKNIRAGDELFIKYDEYV